RLLTAKDHGHGLRPRVRLGLEDRVERLRARRGRLPGFALQNISGFETCFHSASRLCIQRKKSKKSVFANRTKSFRELHSNSQSETNECGSDNCCRSSPSTMLLNSKCGWR